MSGRSSVFTSQVCSVSLSLDVDVDDDDEEEEEDECNVMNSSILICGLEFWMPTLLPFFPREM